MDIHIPLDNASLLLYSMLLLLVACFALLQRWGIEDKFVPIPVVAMRPRYTHKVKLVMNQQLHLDMLDELREGYLLVAASNGIPGGRSLAVYDNRHVAFGHAYT